MWDSSLHHHVYRIYRNCLCTAVQGILQPGYQLDGGFYNQFSGWVGIVCSIAFIGSAIYLMQRYKLEKQLRKEEKIKDHRFTDGVNQLKGNSRKHL